MKSMSNLQKNGAGYTPEVEDVPKNLYEEEDDIAVKCPTCGSEDVRCDEIYTWGSVSISKECKTIDIGDADSEIQGIFCNNCNTQIDIHEMYPDYEYNFN